jgi:ketosteroid isomerase-like protein/Tfp pilus assembly protein PilF
MNNTRLLLFTALFLLGIFTEAFAQDFYLPTSTTSREALAAYVKATQLGANVHFAEARKEIDRALEEDPNFFMAYNYLIQVLTPDNERPALIKRALAIDPSDLNRAERIMRDYLVAVQEDPETTPEQAMQNLVKAYSKTPEAYEWAYLHAAYTQKDRAAALNYAETLMQLAPDYGPVHNTVAYIHMDAGEMQEAKQHLDRYVELAPEEANAYDSMGEYYAKNGKYCESAQYYGKAASMGMTTAWERAEKALGMLCEADANAPTAESRMATVAKLYDSFAEGDIPAVVAGLDERVVWREAEGNPLADNNPYVGPDAVLNGVFARLGAEHEYFKLKDIQLHPVAGNQVLATLRYEAKRKTSGRELDVQAAHLWTLRDGKVTAFQQYADTQQIAAAAKK